MAAFAIAGGSANALANVENWAVWLEGVRRAGVAAYLFSILLGLATIVKVLRFQAARSGPRDPRSLDTSTNRSDAQPATPRAASAAGSSRRRCDPPPGGSAR